MYSVCRTSTDDNQRFLIIFTISFVNLSSIPSFQQVSEIRQSNWSLRKWASHFFGASKSVKNTYAVPYSGFGGPVCCSVSCFIWHFVRILFLSCDLFLVSVRKRCNFIHMLYILSEIGVFTFLRVICYWHVRLFHF